MGIGTAIVVVVAFVVVVISVVAAVVVVVIVTLPPPPPPPPSPPSPFLPLSTLSFSVTPANKPTNTELIKSNTSAVTRRTWVSGVSGS
jgi:hypothetical protein